MSYSKKSYCFSNGGKMVTYHGHIRASTAIAKNYDHVVLAVIDHSGRGRGEQRHHYRPFTSMHKK
jgi:hypothetical protein